MSLLVGIVTSLIRLGMLVLGCQNSVGSAQKVESVLKGLGQILLLIASVA